MIRLGLTGSIGMGKSTTAAMFRRLGVPVYDADAAVHRLYRGAAVEVIEAAFPGVAPDGVIDRALLSARVFGDKAAFARLEAIVHPLLLSERTQFLAAQRAAPIVVLDIPLLFETRDERAVDAIIVVTASEKTQRARVLSRPGMSVEKFEAIVNKQWPDAEKRRHAHFIINTDHGLEQAEAQVRAVLRAAVFLGH